MSFLKKLVDQGREIVQDGTRMTINGILATGVVQFSINSQIKKYATIHDLKLTDDGIQIQAQLLGSHDIFTATATNIDIDADNKTFCVQHFKSDMPWADHILNDFVANNTFSLDSLPPMVINTLAGINSLLK